MAEHKKNAIVVGCSVVGCIVTLLTCGILIGGARADISHIVEKQTAIVESQKATETRVSTMETDSAFQKGVVQTHLTVQGAAIVRIEKKLDDLVGAD